MSGLVSKTVTPAKRIRKPIANLCQADNKQQLDRLIQLKELCREWRVVGGRRPPCFEGLLQDIKAVLAMHADLVVGWPLAFLMTGHINQDCLENFFSLIRAKGGHRFNPSAKEFRYAYRNLCSTFILVAIPSSNCAYDSVSSNVHRSTHREGSAAKRPRLESAPMVLSADDFETSSAVTNVLSYIGGYLVKKLLDAQHFTCECCLSALNTDMNVVEDGQLYLHLRAYSHVKGAFGSHCAFPCLYKCSQTGGECVWQAHCISTD